jgi:hypothetical protein
MMQYSLGGSIPLEPPQPVDTEQALRVLNRAREIARDERLTMGASFGHFYGPSSPEQIIITFTPKQDN